MPRETARQRRIRAAEIFQRLRSIYPDAHCELNFSNPLELLVATVLSAQCSDRQVNKVTPALFKKYPEASSYAAAPAGELERDLEQIGLFRAKARNLRAAGERLARLHGGEPPRTMDALTALPGVGRKTANVVLSNAFGIHEGVVVDTHVARLAGRLKLSTAASPVAIETDLRALAPQPDWGLVSHWLIWHGRRRCGARRPDCNACELADLCPSRGLAGAKGVQSGASGNRISPGAGKKTRNRPN